MTIEDAKVANIFLGFQIWKGNFHLSHIFYIDDVIFLDDLDRGDLFNIIRLLQCFYLVFGLKLI